MASLEDRLADKEYKYWVKAGICLSYVKSGLEVFAEERSKKTHDYVNANCIGSNQPGNICNHARIEYNRRAGKWISNCCNDCQKYVDEIVKLQVPPFTFNKYNWQNSNIHQWPTDAWEMMKVFMNPGQKVYQKSPKETDLSGLINFIDHCSVPNVDIQNKINISQVRTSNISANVRVYSCIKWNCAEAYGIKRAHLHFYKRILYEKQLNQNCFEYREFGRCTLQLT